MIYEAFTTQIYRSRLLPTSKATSHRKLNSDLLDVVEVLLTTDEAGFKWSDQNYVAGYTSYGSLDKLHVSQEPYKKLEKLFAPHVDQYLKNLDYDCSVKELALTQCWVNVMPPGALHTAHIHPLSVVSGTYYLQFPKGASAIKFEDPRLGFFMNAPVQKPKVKENQKRFLSVTPNEGDIVLFESWIRHEVLMNTTEEPRITISFNYGWC